MLTIGRVHQELRDLHVRGDKEAEAACPADGIRRLEELVAVAGRANEREQREVVCSHARPCFIVDGSLQQALSRFHNKNEVEVAGSQRSAFEKGVNILYCNATPIAGRTSLPREVAESSIQSLFAAVADLTQTGMTLNLNFGFAQVRIDNKTMTYKYSPSFLERTSKPTFSNCVPPRHSVQKQSRPHLHHLENRHQVQLLPGPRTRNRRQREPVPKDPRPQDHVAGPEHR